MIKSKMIRLIKLLITFNVSLLLVGCVGNTQYNLIRHGVVVDDIKSAVAEGLTDPMSASERVASIADLMEGIKNSKTPDWLIRELDKPDRALALEMGHAEWSWYVPLNNFGRKVGQCSQIFYVNTAKKQITGWATDCPAGNYGSVALSTPRPPETGKILKRAKTFTDYLTTIKNYQEIAKKYPELTPEPVAMADGKKNMIFTRNWNTYHNEVDGYEWICDGYGCATWDTYTSIATPQTCQWSVTVDHAGTIVGWDTSKCEFAGIEDQSEYGYISTLIPVPPRAK